MRWVLWAFLCCCQRQKNQIQLRMNITAVFKPIVCVAGVLALKYFNRSVALKTPPCNFICAAAGVYVFRYISIYIEVKFTFNLSRYLRPCVSCARRLDYIIMFRARWFEMWKGGARLSERVEQGAHTQDNNIKHSYRADGSTLSLSRLHLHYGWRKNLISKCSYYTYIYML